MVWLIGNKGMLGKDLERELMEAGIGVKGSGREVSILEPEALAVFASGYTFHWIVNCAAYTAVDKAEEEPGLAYKVNRDGAANIAALAASLDIPLIHISTDYVFGGVSPEPLKEDAPTNPKGVYGASKLAGEGEIRKIWNRHFIIRTAWLYGQYGSNFVYSMIRLMNERGGLKVVDDQIGSPTWTRDLARAICRFIGRDSEEYGTYHLSGEGQCSWFGFAKEIYSLARSFGLVHSDCQLMPCTSGEFPTPAARPAFSLLSKEKITNWGYPVPRWQDSLRIFLKGITPYDIP